MWVFYGALPYPDDRCVAIIAGDTTTAQCIAGDTTTAQCIAGDTTTAQCIAGDWGLGTGLQV
ncbi:MAG: hypothetical protein ACSI46_10325 [Gloeotrichia echinulata DVL01]|nr:hypothetical protein [Gloeotrichia echinulata DEX184]